MKLFRKIRNRMLKENRVTRYFLYAIGEIILVVIGILIALQVNNWNGERQLANEECLLLMELVNHLRANNVLIDSAHVRMKVQVDHTKQLIDIMSSKPSEADLGKVDGLLYEGSEVEMLQLQMAGVESVIGRHLGLISNDSIQRLLLRYPSRYQRYKEQEAVLRSLTDTRIRPRVKQHIFLHTIPTGSNAFPSDRLALLSDRTLANDLVDRYWESDDWVKKALKVQGLGKQLINAIEEHLQSHCTDR